MVRKFGHATSGESWDVVEQMDTYYNPRPHFTFEMARDHSPTLMNLPARSRDDALRGASGDGGGDGGFGVSLSDL